ncbi:MAG: hypothetical protein L0K86_01050 [Actinomycetia bacterium]|nr:hypothetical protein [Actinomycetes bacterium]
MDEIKHYNGAAAVECELTPDDSLYDEFTSTGLPITSGGIWPDESTDPGTGPTGATVGVYGVFAGDYGHGGRPEVHPFDAFWRRFHNPRSNNISWDLGIFQDDSNRFNNDWSQPPIEVEFKVPFCVDVPFTRRRPIRRHLIFTIHRSPRCGSVGKNTRSLSQSRVFRETFTAHTVRWRPRDRNTLNLSVEDDTRLAGQPFAIRLDDLAYTVGGRRFDREGWLSGSIAVRAAINQDGFLYANISGPNSTTAADASSRGGVVVDDEFEQVGEFERVVRPALDSTHLRAAEPSSSDRPPIRRREPGPRQVRTRAVISDDERPSLSAEVVVELPSESNEPRQHTVTVHPRQEATVLLDGTDATTTVNIDSFDLFATAEVEPARSPSTRLVADIVPAIVRLSGLERLGYRALPLETAIEVDDYLHVNLGTRYAPFRNGATAGEERTTLSEVLSESTDGQTTLEGEMWIVNADGTQQRTQLSSNATTVTDAAARFEERDRGYHLVLGPFGNQPTSLHLQARLKDAYGLTSHVSARTDNYRIIQAQSWLEQVWGVRLEDLTRWYELVAMDSHRAPNATARATEAMLEQLLEIVRGLDEASAIPAGRVAGALRFAHRTTELISQGSWPTPRALGRKSGAISSTAAKRADLRRFARPWPRFLSR